MGQVGVRGCVKGQVALLLTKTTFCRKYFVKFRQQQSKICLRFNLLHATVWRQKLYNLTHHFLHSQLFQKDRAVAVLFNVWQMFKVWQQI
jgi:hypothetical protein